VFGYSITGTLVPPSRKTRVIANEVKQSHLLNDQITSKPHNHFRVIITKQYSIGLIAYFPPLWDSTNDTGRGFNLIMPLRVSLRGAIRGILVMF
jgi:hypothetical protein